MDRDASADHRDHNAAEQRTENGREVHSGRGLVHPTYNRLTS